MEHHNDNRDNHDSAEYNDDIYNIIKTIANQNEITFKECANDIFVDVYLVNNKSLYFSDEYIINNLQLQPLQQTPIVENEIPTMDDWELVKNYYDYLEGLIFADIEFLDKLVLESDVDVVR